MKQTLFILACLCYSLNMIASNSSFSKKEQDRILLDNGFVNIAFAGKDEFKILNWSDKENKISIQTPTTDYPWEFELIGPNGENPLLRPKNGIYEGVSVRESNDKTTLIFKWQMILVPEKSSEVRVEVSLTKDSRLTDWDFEMDLPKGWKISKLTFPRIAVNKPENSKILTSAGWGTEYPFSAGDNYSARYPSCTGAMQLMCVYNGHNTIYYATHDKNACDKTFKASASRAQATLTTNIITSESWSPAEGGTFRLPWITVIGITDKGWQNAVVEWYKPFSYTTEWGNKKLSDRNIPEWLYNADIWLRPMNVTSQTMDAVRQSLDYYGKGVAFHWYYWHNHPFDTNYPDYFPAKEDFSSMVKETRKLGGYVTPYINGRLWDPATESYKQMNGSAASSRKADGTLYTEVYSSRILNTVTCPASDIWQNILLNTVSRIQDELGTNGVYLDQIAAAPSEPCWAKNHGHAPGGGDFWPVAYRHLMNNMRNKHLIKDNILTSEENAECYIDLFDMMLTVNTPRKGSVIVPLFPLVYSDRVITSAFSYNPKNLNSITFRFANVMSLLWGSQLGWANPEDLMKPEAKAEAAYLKELGKFRSKQHDLFYGGELLEEVFPKGDNPTLQIPDFSPSPAVRGAIWKGPEGKTALLLVNIDEKPHAIELQNGRKIELKGREYLRIDKNFK